MKQRRIVHNPATCHVVPALEKFLNDFNPTLTALVLTKDACKCIMCVRSIEKLQKLMTDLRERNSSSNKCSGNAVWAQSM
jgi:hypothetical protein